MNTLRNLSELHLNSIPITGTYGDYIGTASIIYGDNSYTVKVMTQTGTLDVKNKGKNT
jgi:hypothetical protein